MKRAVVQVDNELHARIRKVIPWGFRHLLFAQVMDLIVTVIEKIGPGIIPLLLEGQFKLTRLEDANGLNEPTWPGYKSHGCGQFYKRLESHKTKSYDEQDYL